jgi:hypothetical protein
MSKSTQVLSLSVPPDLINNLNDANNRRGYHNRSRLACELLEDFCSLDLESHIALRQAAENKGVPVSELVEFLLGKFPLNDATVKPIVLRIPVNILNDRESLEDWLSQKSAVLVNHLHPKESP